MAFVFHRQLDIPLWPVAFFAVALIAPPATLFLIAIVGIGAIAFTTAGLVPWLRTSRMDDDGGWQMARPPA